MHYSLSEFPECRVSLAKRTDVVDQVLAMALHPAYDLNTAKMSVSTIINVTQSPEAHIHIVREDVLEKMLKICEEKEKQESERSLNQQGDPMAVKVLKYIISLSV